MLGINFVPAPNINATPEFFYFGEDIIGGFLNVEINGTHYAQNESEYNSVSEDILNLIDSCVDISDLSFECEGLSSISLGGQGLVKDARVSHGGSPLNLSYSIVIECSKGIDKKSLIANTTDLPFAELLGDTIVVNSYSETTTASSAGSTFAANGGGSFSKNMGKLSVQIDIGLYDSDVCDTNETDMTQEVEDYLKSRIQTLADENGAVIGNIAKLSLRKTGGSASFDLYMVPAGSAKALVDYNESQSTDPITGFNTSTVRGNIVGLDSSKNFLEPNEDGMDNAKATYASFINAFVPGSSSNIDVECGEQEAVSPNKDGTCYILASQRVSENQGANSIDFELIYRDVEQCELLGYKITSNYEERPSVQSRVQHLIPGVRKSPTYYSTAVSAPKYKLTVNGEITASCIQNAGGALPETASNGTTGLVKSGVNAEFAAQKQMWGLTNGNLIKVSRSVTEGRYSYSVSEEYIECE